jgi:hypothetical protein
MIFKESIRYEKTELHVVLVRDRRIPIGGWNFARVQD